MLLRFRHSFVTLLVALVPSTTNAVQQTNPIPGPPDDCTYTQGFWKNHPDKWPVDSLSLGNVSYSQEELLSIFDEPVGGNGLISLAHQLIAVKLNIAAGADPSDVDPEVSEADDLIGDLVVPPVGGGFLAPSITGPYTELFDRYNKGYIGPGHCGGGACCLPDGSCGVLESGECEGAGGVFFGAGAACDPDPCITPPSGACCLPTTGDCIVMTAAECSESGGAYYGDGSTCDPSPCDTPGSGACCLANGICIVMSASECAARGGTYQGDDVACDPNPCAPRTGACCLDPTGDCEVMTMAACEAAGGTYVGDDIACNPGLCPPTATEPVTWGRLKRQLDR